MLELKVGTVGVETTSHRGFTPEEIAERCLDRILSVSDTAHPTLKQQALAYRSQIRSVLLHYMQEAINSDRTTIYNALLDAGQKDLAEAIRRL